MHRPEMGSYPVRTDLPEAHLTEIGRLVFQFAFIETQLWTITYHVLGLDKKQGRLAVVQRRAHEQVDLLQVLLELQNIKLPVDWKTLKAAIKEIKSYRDRVAHGVWLEHPQTANPVLQDFSTEYVQGIEKGHKAKIHPIAAEVPIDLLRNINGNAAKISSRLKKIEDLVLQ